MAKAPALRVFCSVLLLFESAKSATPFLPPSIDGDVTEWVDDRAIDAVACADRIYLRLNLPEAVVLQDASEVILYFDTDNNESTGLPVHGLGAEIRWDAGRRSGEACGYNQTGEVFIEVISQAWLDLRVSPVHDSASFEISIRRPGSGQGACRIAVERNSNLVGEALADYRGRSATRSLAPDRAPYTDIRVLSYNVLNDDLLDRPEKKDLFMDEFRELRPDVICFMEIYDHDAETARACVAEALPYMLHASGGRRLDSRRLRGNRIVSRHPILFSETYDRFHAARVRSEAGDIDIMIIAAHLTCCSFSYTRELEMAMISRFVADLRAGRLPGVPSDLPVILAGDLNLVRWDTKAFQSLQLETGLRPLPAMHLDSLADYTWRDDAGSFAPGRLDYVLTGRGMVKCRAFVFRSPLPPSDHLPLVADLAIDLDGNGLSDGWERHYFGRTRLEPGADPDGDRFTNALEHRLGTNPNRGEDRPQLKMTSDGGALRLRMPIHGQGSASFQLWQSSDLIFWQKVPGRWWPDDAALTIGQGDRPAFFRATPHEQ